MITDTVFMLGACISLTDQTAIIHSHLCQYKLMKMTPHPMFGNHDLIW